MTDPNTPVAALSPASRAALNKLRWAMIHALMRWEDEVADDVLDETDDACEALKQAICAIIGHDPIADQCGRPEHDLCAACQTGTPGQAH